MNRLGATAGQIVYERHALPDSRPIRALVVAEEAGEVSRAVLKAEQGIRGSEDYWRDELVNELAGVVIAAASCAAQWGIDLETAVAQQIERLDALPVGAWKVPRPAST